MTYQEPELIHMTSIDYAGDMQAVIAVALLVVAVAVWVWVFSPD